MLSIRPAMEGNLVAGFDLPRAGGGRVRLRGYRGRRSLAVWFVHGAGCGACRETAAAIVPRYGDYAYADAEPLLIVPGPATAAEALRRELALPYPVLIDEDGAVAHRYGSPGAALLIADRFGAPTTWHPAGHGHDLPGQDTVLQELEYLSHTCSAGRATPTWPDVDG
ncbi:MAG: redoxin domain-containing protein [Chloroflexi bacterium]|nr:redoxin domain-containing protein [Chloroflexota bacterium]